VVYLLHYETALFHAQHYIGFAEGEARIKKHAQGRSGAHLPSAFFRAGTHFVVARRWDGDRTLERRLKNTHNARRLCPICRAAALARHSANQRAYTARQRAKRNQTEVIND
jgi:hypothetical protein